MAARLVKDFTRNTMALAGGCHGSELCVEHVRVTQDGLSFWVEKESPDGEWPSAVYRVDVKLSATVCDGSSDQSYLEHVQAGTKVNVMDGIPGL